MNKFFQNKYFSILVRIILGAILIYSSLDKIDNRVEFIKIVNHFHILPAVVVNLFAITLPWVELLTGLFLIVGKYVKAASLLYSVLLVVFIVALLQAELRGINTNCGCFSLKAGEDSNLWLRMFLDLIMLFFSVNLYLTAPESDVILSEAKGHPLGHPNNQTI